MRKTTFVLDMIAVSAGLSASVRAVLSEDHYRNCLGRSVELVAGGCTSRCATTANASFLIVFAPSPVMEEPVDPFVTSGAVVKGLLTNQQSAMHEQKR